MANRPVLDDLELPLAQRIDSEHDQVLARTDVPGLEGDFYASEGRRATRFTLTGVVSGAEAAEGLKKLRDEFASAAPVPFVSDISTATRVDKVLIEELGVREIAGRPQRFEYAFTLREFIPAPEPEIIIPPPPPPPVEPTTSLEVRVEVLGEPDFDFSRITVTVVGTKQNGEAFPLTTLTKAPQGNVWPRDPMDPGRYTFTATAPADDMSNRTEAEVIAGVRPNVVTLVLQRNSSLVGVTWVVHYRFDKSLVEPCMREVLADVHARATSGPSNEKLLIVGHTDKTGSDEYNQSLSERRARGAFAYLTYRRDPAAAVAEWDQLRRQQATAIRTINDNWGTRQYQYMLLDLGYYAGRIDGVHGDITTAAVRRFQHDRGLPETGFVSDDATWRALIDAYLKLGNLDIPDAKFLRNANPAAGCDGGILKWVGCGEEDPVLNTPNAWRPNRRTELIFLRVQELPCKVAEPVTFNLPGPGAVSPSWCLDDTGDAGRSCFLRRAGGAHQEPHRILVQPVHQPGAAVTLRLTFEDGTPAVNVPYVLIAPDGEFMDGEVGSPGDPRRGEPIPGFVGSNGEHAYAKSAGAVGVWTLEVQASVVARLRERPPGSGKGPVVCTRLDGDGEMDVVLSARPQSFEFVDAANVDQTLDTVVFGQPFRLRADIPGETRDEVEVELMSYLIKR